MLGVLPDNRIASATGTSQAAPQVAAAASLLMVKQRMMPYAVKQRLVACSNIDFGLLGGVGGLLDIGCALHSERDLLERGAVAIPVTVFDIEPSMVIFSPIGGGIKRAFPEESILSIAKQESGAYTVFYTLDGHDIHSSPDLVPEDDSDPLLKYRGENNEIDEVRLSDVSRWVRRAPQ